MKLTEKIDNYLIDQPLDEGFFKNIVKKAAKKGLNRLIRLATDFLIIFMQTVNQQIQSTISDITIGTAMTTKKSRQIEVLKREADYHKEEFLKIMYLIENEIDDLKDAIEKEDF
jgi:hypothetical protein